MADRNPPGPPGRALGASPGLDDSLLDEVNDYLGEVALNPPGPLSPKSERLRGMANAAKEAGRRAAQRVRDADARAQASRDNALRAQAQLDLLRDLQRGAANPPAGPAGGSAGPGPSSVAPAAAPTTLSTPSSPPPGPSCLCRRCRGRLGGCRIGRRRGPVGPNCAPRRPFVRTRPGSATRPTGARWPGTSRTISRARAWRSQTTSRSAVNRGESQATECRQNLRLVERHGPRVAAEFTGTPLLSPEAHTRLRSICKDERQRLSDLRVRTGSGVNKPNPNRQARGWGFQAPTW